MKKRFQAVLLSILVVSALVLTSSAQQTEEDTVMTLSGGGVNAEAAIVIELKTGRVLFEQNADTQLPIASTTKILTALIALEQPDIDAQFEVDSHAIQVEGSSMGLLEGDKVSLRSLSVGMLLASGNDAANAAAVRISGSIPSFVELMNRRAQEIGMTNSSFETPSGLDGPEHYSTARDMALLARTALQNDDFREICSQYKMQTSYGNPPYDRWLTNHNRLLNSYEGAIGVKTGFTKKAGRCLVSAAERDGVELIVITLDCPDDWQTHSALFDRYFAELELVDLAESMPEVTIPVTGGFLSSVGAVRYEPAPLAVSRDNPNIEYKVFTQRFLYAPITSGQSVGELRIYVEGEHAASLSLVADRDVLSRWPVDDDDDGIFHDLGEKIKGLFSGDD